MQSTQITVGSLIKVNIQAKNEEDLFVQASFWYELPCKCGKCDSANLGLRHRQTKDYEFFELKCLDCEATFACGQKKDGGLYPRGDKDTGEWEVKYEGGDRRDSDRGDDRRRSDRGRDDSRDNRGRGRDREPTQRGSYRRGGDGGDGPINDY